MGPSPKDIHVFTHPGTITAVTDTFVRVTLDANVHCESCHAKGACGVSEGITKAVEVAAPRGQYRLHEPVEVLLRKDLGQKAVFWAYLFPFLLMLATLLTTSLFATEWVAGVASLLVLVPYYLLVYGLRTYFKKTFTVSLLKTRTP